MKPFGRNQLLAICGYGVPLLGAFVLVLLGKVSGEAWLNWTQVYVPVAVGTTLTVSGGLKAVGLLAAARQSDAPDAQVSP